MIRFAGGPQLTAPVVLIGVSRCVLGHCMIQLLEGPVIYILTLGYLNENHAIHLLDATVVCVCVTTTPKHAPEAVHGTHLPTTRLGGAAAR